MNLSEYQDLAQKTDQRPGKSEDALVFPLVGLASEVGSLMSQFKRRIRDGESHSLFSERVAEELGDIMWYVANLADKLDLNLESIATQNLSRTSGRWAATTGPDRYNLLDESYCAAERLPRRTSVEFVESNEHGRQRVRLTCDGRQLGDPLSDMSWDQDDYRYHDAFHLGYAAMLGWSPITRSFFGCQRRSNERLREIEDSGRAKVIEEAIAAIAFEYARGAHYLEGVRHIDTSLLQTIGNMTSKLEVRVRTSREWEVAILRSFEMWRLLKTHGGGTVHLDLIERDVWYESPA